MTISKGLRGRAATRRARTRRAWLLAILVLVPIGLRVLAVAALRLEAVATRYAMYDTAAHIVANLAGVVQCLGYIIGGLAIDRLGLKRTIGLVVLAWAVLMTLGSTIVDPLAYRTLSMVPMALLPGFLVTSLLVAARLSWSARRRAVVVAGLLVTYQYALHTRFCVALLDVAGDWRSAMLASVILAAILFAVWMLTFVDVDEGAGLDLRPSAPPGGGDAATRAMLAAPATWIIVALAFFQYLAATNSLQISWQLEKLSESGPAWGAQVAGVATQAGFLAAASWSDRRYRSRRDWLAARRPPIVAGLLVAAVAATLGLFAQQSGPALQIIDLVAIGVSQIVDLLIVDCAPRQLTGRFVGLVLAGESANSFYFQHPFGSLGPPLPHEHVILAVAAALVGAALAVRLLPRLRPTVS